MNEEKKTKKETIAANKALLKKYPILKPRFVSLKGAKYDYTYTELDTVCMGWHKMFLELCDAIMAHLKKVHIKPSEFYFFDIKEKWGSLRITCGGYDDDEIERMILDAEDRSLLFCPRCGKPTKYVTRGYVLYLCPECYAQSKLTGTLLTPADIPTITEYNNEKGTSTKRPTAYDADFRATWTGKEGT